MTVASWHRGEPCSPGSRRSGAESGISFPERPPSRPARLQAGLPSSRFPACSTHSCASLGTPPGPPQGLPPGAWPDQLELEGEREVNAGGGEPSLPSQVTPPLTLPAADRSPDLGTPRGRESCLRPFLASRDRFAVGGPGLETRGAERAGRGAGPGRGALTQAATSRPAAASSSRVGPTPGNSSGLGRLLSTSWASARPRATWRSSARDCGDPAGVRRGGAPARAPPPPPRPPASGLTEGRGGSLLRRNEQLRGLQLSVSSSCGTRAGVTRSLLARAPEALGRRRFLDVARDWPGRLCLSCPEPGSAPMAERG